MISNPLTKLLRFTTVIIKSGDEVRCPCGQKLAQVMVSGETWYKCRACKEDIKVIVQ